MQVLAIALGGCVRGTPRYGVTEDTGGHITYLLGSMRALSEREDVSRAEIVTRMFDAPDLGAIHSCPSEQIAPCLVITRIDSGNRKYLAKERLAADLPAFTAALIAELQSRDRLPDVIHAHFADAAQVAADIRDALGIPFIYTAHSLGIDKRGTCDTLSVALEARIAQEDSAIAAADLTIGSSRDECERQLVAYPSADGTRIERIRPGIDKTPASSEDMTRASALIEPFLRNVEKPIILAIARPVKKKNLAALVEAYAHSEKLRQSANLVILPGLRHSVGHGEAEQVEVLRNLIDLIDGHDLHGMVAYPRQHDASQVRGLYALARQSMGVFVNPALVEPFGLTILEAAVHGLPVVATCHGGPSDIIDEIEHGVVVEPTDPGAISTAIETIMTDSTAWHRASANALANIRRVTWTHYARSFHKVAAALVRPAATPTVSAKQPTLLISDIDNTLTGCRASAARLTQFLGHRDDVAFGVATGRSLTEARRVMRDWDLPEPAFWITSVGTEIYWQKPNGLVADEVFAAMHDNAWDHASISAALDGIRSLKPQGVVDQRQFKLSYTLDDVSQLSAVRAAVISSGIPARVVFSHDHLLDVLPLSAGKSAAVSHVAATFGLAMDRIIVAGDSGNDTDMLTDCPNAVVVGNCEPELRILGEKGMAYQAQGNHAAGVLEGLRMYLQAWDEDFREDGLLEHAA